MAKSIPRCSKKNKLAILDEYFNNGMNMTRAVMKVLPSYSKNSASVLGTFIKKEYIKEIDKRQKEVQEAFVEEMYTKQILSYSQRQQVLSGIILSDDSSFTDKINAIREMNKMEGVGGNSSLTQINVNVPMAEKRRIVEAEVTELLNEGSGESQKALPAGDTNGQA